MMILRAKFLRATALMVLIFGLSYCALLSKSRRPKVTVTKSHQSIGRYEVLELNFRHRAGYDNPWEDVVITVDFIHESGLMLHVGGFYFDKGLLWFSYYLKDLTLTPAARSTTIDIILLGITCNIWMYQDAKKNKVPHFWIYLVAFWMVAMAAVFPIYLINRKKYLKADSN